MATDERFDKTISAWLEGTAPSRLPERVLDATFERTRKSRQQVGWRGLLGRIRITRFAPALSGAVVVVLAAALALSYYSNQAGVGGTAAAFAGNWESTDPPPDSSHLSMEVIRLSNGTYSVTIRDDLASVCDGVSSTMTGVAEARDPGRLVIGQPAYACDDGSKPQALSGPPLEEQLRNLAFVYDFQGDQLQDSFGLVWSRVAMGP